MKKTTIGVAIFFFLLCISVQDVKAESNAEQSISVPFLPLPILSLDQWLDAITATSNEERVLSGKTVVLDAGHGGKDNGASANALKEKNINLTIALKVAKTLEEAGAQVILTRDKDITLKREQRYSIASQQKADIFISLHANSGMKQVNGLETFYHHQRDENLANVLQTHLINETSSRNRGVKYGDYYVLRENTVPSALIEMGFLTNFNEANKLMDNTFHDSIAKGIVNGLVDYFN